MAAGYDAFISYSHAIDQDLARSVKHGMQRLAKPWYRRRALKVFLDESSMPATSGLWETVLGAVERSRFLVLFASPEAAASAGVEREVREWIRLGRSEQLLVCLTSGEIHAGAAGIDWSRTNALPRCLQESGVVEPLWVDLRPNRDPATQSPRNPAFQQALARVCASIRDTTPDELISRDVKEHRRTKIVASIAVAAIALSGAAAFWQYRDAVAARREESNLRQVAEATLREKKTSLARAHRAQSVVHFASGRQDEAFEEAVAANVEDSDVVSSADVAHAFARTGDRLWQTPAPFSGFLGDFVPVLGGRAVVATAPGGEVRCWDVASGRVLRRVGKLGAGLRRLAVTDDGRRWAALTREGRLRIVELGEDETLLLDRPFEGRWLELDEDGSRALLIDEQGRVSTIGLDGAQQEVALPERGGKPVAAWFEGEDAVWVVRRESRLVRVPLAGGVPREIEVADGARKPRAVVGALRPAGRVMGVRRRGALQVVSLSDGAVLRTLGDEVEGRRIDLEQVRSTPDGARLWVPERSSGRLVSVRVEDGAVRVLECAPLTALQDDHIDQVEPVGEDRLLVVRGRVMPPGAEGWERLHDYFFASRRLVVLDAGTGKGAAERPIGYDAFPTAVAYAPGGRRIAAGFADGSLALLDATDGSVLARWRPHEEPVVGVAFAAAGAELVSVARRGGLAVSDGSSGGVARRVPLPDDAVVGFRWSDSGRRALLGLSAWASRAHEHADPEETDERPAAAASRHYGLLVDLDGGRPAIRLDGPGFPLVDLVLDSEEDRAFAVAGAFLHRWHLDAAGGDPLPANAPGRVLMLGSGAYGLQAGLDRRLRVALDTGEIVEVDPDSLQEVQRHRAFTTAARGWRQARSGAFTVVVGGCPGTIFTPTRPEVGEVHVLDAVTGEARTVLDGHVGGVEAFDLAPDESEIATVGRDGRIRLWSLRPEPRRHDLVRIDRRGAEVVAVGPDARAVVRVTGQLPTAGQEVRFHRMAIDLVTGRTLASLGDAPDDRGAIAVFSPDGSRVVQFLDPDLEEEDGETRMAVWDLGTGERVWERETRIPSPFPDDVSFSPDGRTLWVGEGDEEGSLLGFDLHSDRPPKEVRVGFETSGAPAVASDGVHGFVLDAKGAVRPFGPAGAAAAIPDLEADGLVWSRGGRWCLATTGRNAVAVIDPAAARVVRTIDDVRAFLQPALDPDEFVTYEEDAIELWSAATGARLWASALVGEVEHLATSSIAPTVTIAYRLTSGTHHLADVVDLSRARTFARRLPDLAEGEGTSFARRWRNRFLDGVPSRETPPAADDVPDWLRPEAPGASVSASELALWEDLATLRAAEVGRRTTPARAPGASTGEDRAAVLHRRISSPGLANLPKERRTLARELAQIAPSRADAWASVAWASLQVARTDGTVEDFDEALAAGRRAWDLTDSPEWQGWRGLVSQVVAEAYRELGCIAESIPYYEEATRVLDDPNRANRDNLYYLMSHQGHCVRYADAARTAARHEEIRGLVAGDRTQFRAWAEAYAAMARIQEGAPRLPLLFFSVVPPGSAAAAAGIRPWDALLAVDGAEPVDARDMGFRLNAAVSAARPADGPSPHLTVWRDGRRVVLPAPRDLRGVRYDAVIGPAPILLVVNQVTADSQAQWLGIQVGDVLWSLGGRRLANPVELREAVAVGAGTGRTLEVRRLRTGPNLGYLPSAPREGARAEDDLGWEYDRFEVEVEPGALGVVAVEAPLSPPVRR